MSLTPSFTLPSCSLNGEQSKEGNAAGSGKFWTGAHHSCLSSEIPLRKLILSGSLATPHFLLLPGGCSQEHIMIGKKTNKENCEAYWIPDVR